MELLENQMATSKARLADLSKFRRKLAIWSGILLVISIIFLNLLTNDGPGEIGFPLWLAMAVVAAILAHFRDKSKIGAFILGFVTVGIMPICSSVKGLWEALKTNPKYLIAEQNNLQAQINELATELNASRAALNELNTRKTALEVERGNEDND
jgi:uncharacterized membrane protein YhdT